MAARLQISLSNWTRIQGCRSLQPDNLIALPIRLLSNSREQKNHSEDKGRGEQAACGEFASQRHGNVDATPVLPGFWSLCGVEDSSAHMCLYLASHQMFPSEREVILSLASSALHTEGDLSGQTFKTPCTELTRAQGPAQFLTRHFWVQLPHSPLAAIVPQEHLPRETPLLVKEAVALTDVHTAAILQEESRGATAACRNQMGLRQEAVYPSLGQPPKQKWVAWWPFHSSLESHSRAHLQRPACQAPLGVPNLCFPLPFN